MQSARIASLAAKPDLLTPGPVTLVGSVATPSYMISSTRYLVHVDGLDDINADISASAVPTSQTAILITFSGGPGGGYWTDGLPDSGFVNAMVTAGTRVYSVSWVSAWFTAPLGARLGPHRVSARIAAVIRKLRADNPGSELWLVGGSGGGGQVAMYLAFYGGAAITKRAVMAAGPVAAIQRICSGFPQDAAFLEGSNDTVPLFIDSAYGYAANTGPCYLGAGTAEQTRYNEADFSMSDLSNMDWSRLTKLHFVMGGADAGPADLRARTWLDNHPPVGKYTYETVAGVGHTVHSDPAGELAIRRALLLLPNVHQISPSVSNTTSAGVTATLPYRTNVGGLLVAQFVANVAGTNNVAPSGWTATPSQQLGATSAYMTIYTRIITGTETSADLTFNATGAALKVLRVFEVGNFTTANPGVDRAGSGSGSGTSTGTIATTNDIRATPELAIAFIGFSNTPGTQGSWGGGFTQIYSDSTYMAAAISVRNTIGSPSSSTSWTTSRSWAFSILTLRSN